MLSYARLPRVVFSVAMAALLGSLAVPARAATTGVATSLNELATLAGLGIEINERAIPVRPVVAAACEILGLDPLQVANEGKLLAIVPADAADHVLAAMRSHEYGRDAVAIGRMVENHPRMVVMRTAIGGTRVIPMPLGEQLPRIC